MNYVHGVETKTTTNKVGDPMYILIYFNQIIMCMNYVYGEIIEITGCGNLTSYINVVYVHSLFEIKDLFDQLRFCMNYVHGVETKTTTDFFCGDHTSYINSVNVQKLMYIR